MKPKYYLFCLFLLFVGCFQTETWTTINSKGGMVRKIDIQIDKASKEQLKSKKDAFINDGWTVTEEEKHGKYFLIAKKEFNTINNYKSPLEDSEINFDPSDNYFSEYFNAKKSAGITDTSRSGWKDLFYRFSVTFPYTILNSNAKSVDENTAKWEWDVNDVFDNETLYMYADCENHRPYNDISNKNELKDGTVTFKKKDTIKYKTAVVEFAEKGKLELSDAGTIVAEWLSASLANTGSFEIYERLSLDQVTKELNFQISDLVDESTVAKIGKIKGVPYIVTGSISKLGNIISVTAKLIDTETSKVVRSSVVKVTDIDEIAVQIDVLANQLAGN